MALVKVVVGIQKNRHLEYSANSLGDHFRVLLPKLGAGVDGDEVKRHQDQHGQPHQQGEVCSPVCPDLMGMGTLLVQEFESWLEILDFVREELN